MLYLNQMAQKINNNNNYIALAFDKIKINMFKKNMTEKLFLWDVSREKLGNMEESLPLFAKELVM